MVRNCLQWPMINLKYEISPLKIPREPRPGQAHKWSKGAQNDQKLGKYVPKLELLVGYFQDFLGTGSRDIHDENLIRPPA